MCFFTVSILKHIENTFDIRFCLISSGDIIKHCSELLPFSVTAFSEFRCRETLNSVVPFCGWGWTVSKPLRGDNLLFTIKSPGVPGTQLIDLGRMKDWIYLGASQWFWTFILLCQWILFDWPLVNTATGTLSSKQPKAFH